MTASAHVAERADVVVVGAGVGGLAVAIRLAVAGRRVVVLERNDVDRRQAGDGPRRRGHVRRRAVAADAAARVRRAVPRRPARRWPTRSTLVPPRSRSSATAGPTAPSLVVPDDGDARVAAFEALAARRRSGVAAVRRARPAHLGRQRADVPRRSDDRSARAGCAGCARPATSSPSIRCGRCTAAPPPRSTTRASCSGPGRYATYSGSSPYRAPATLACIPHVESRYGCWYPRGRARRAAGRAGPRGRARRCRRADRGRRRPHPRRATAR